MSLFEYLSVFLSVIMGLGVTHILAGLSKTIHYRRTLKLFWVHTLWAINILIYIVIIWWGMFWWSKQVDWSFFEFLLLLLYAIALFLAASLLFPWELPKDFDFEVHFTQTRVWFFAVIFFAWCLDIPETVLKAEEGVRALPQIYLVLIATQLSLAAVAICCSNLSFHRFYAVFWPVFTVGYLSLTTLAVIAS
ncbi:hypothetical protein E2F43_15710 [Seongchinamella unica]|uniref:Uncharacterized protein n=1 Tax=Seongchinamella unica TaxID=2547392 RepID=A0A4R5LND9_9GAMM|nr:hypothetical protein [Seongchinamella unica]TDG11816.1 hypothetical protein E2F43_15710 [Seongchinamella unica]